MNFSKEQIKEIADMLNTRHHVYCANPDKGEIEIMLDDEILDSYGISWEDDEEEEENLEKESTPNWEDELHDDVKAQMERINSWERTIKIEKPGSHEAFRFMEQFIEDVIPEGKLKAQLWIALSGSHPFRNFNDIVHECDYREDWFAFKQEALEKYVRRELGVLPDEENNI